MSLTKVSYSMITGAPVNILDFGADPTGSADSTTALQDAIDYVSSLQYRPTIVIPVGTYKLISTINITDDNISIVGLGSPSVNTSAGTTRGAVLRFFGLSAGATGLRIGKSVGSNGDFITGTIIENIRIEVDDDTSYAMQVWHSSHGYFKNITIFGNKGSSKVGLIVQAGIDNVYEQIEINGSGQTPASTPADYARGLVATLGYNNDTATTTIFKNCYFHYCCYGVELNYSYDFDGCIFEACYNGVQVLAAIHSQFINCWWEANTNLDIYATGITSDISIIGGRINAYSRDTFFNPGGGVRRFTLKDVWLQTSSVTSYLFAQSANITDPAGTGQVVMTGCILPSGMLIGGVNGSPYSSYPATNNADQKLVVYRFKATNVAISTSYSPMTRADDVAGGAYVMPMEGSIVAINVYYTAAISAGSFNISTKINGSAVTGFSYPTQPNFTSSPQYQTRDILENKVVKGDALTTVLSTNGTFAPTAGDFTFEVLVLHGKSGI